MAVEVLRPGAVSVSGAMGAPAPVLVGDPPQWADASDATYSTTYSTRDAAGFAAGLAGAYLPAHNIDPESVTEISLWMRCATTAIAGNSRAVDAFLRQSPASSTLLQFGQTLTLNQTDDVIEVEVVGGHSSLTWAGVAQAIVGGSHIQLRSAYRSGDISPATSSLTIYELEVRLTYDAKPPRIRPHSRVIQRGDGLGIGGARRAFGSRTVQASNRRGAAIR